jgi:hypothetical protein
VLRMKLRSGDVRVCEGEGCAGALVRLKYQIVADPPNIVGPPDPR